MLCGLGRKDHLTIKTSFELSHGWSLFWGGTVFVTISLILHIINCPVVHFAGMTGIPSYISDPSWGHPTTAGAGAFWRSYRLWNLRSRRSGRQNATLRWLWFGVRHADSFSLWQINAMIDKPNAMQDCIMINVINIFTMVFCEKFLPAIYFHCKL